MLDNTGSTGPSSSSDAFTSLENGLGNKRKRRPAGTPDPIGIGPIHMRDLQPGVSEGPESTDAQEEAQGALEIAQEGIARGEEAGLRVPGA
ncbi:hypothetical protein L1049_007217 [Liquidambar formosana]|uniref:Uncharacterized protein n=1 Tax=Liquidambar formosana TaxID=63359 RepID=A0AAP0RIK9_LIQFO